MIWQLIADGRPLVSGEWWADNWAPLAIALAIAVVVSMISRRWLHRFRKRARSAGDDVEGRRLRRVATVVGLLSGVVVVVAWFVFVLIFLSALGANIAPLIASAGIAGIALGFGAQTVVRDTLSGLFIFLEGQFDIGDVVDLTTSSATVSGTVEAVTLRITSVRQFDGTLSIVPNGLIEIANNRTRGWGRAIVDVRVALSEDPERVRRVLEELFDQLVQEVPVRDWLRERPQVLGVTQLTDTTQVIRVTAETQPSNRVGVERLLRERIGKQIAERGIHTPPTPGVPVPRPDVGP